MTHDDVQRYLDTLAEAMRLDAQRRAAIVDELRDHLIQRVEELRDTGMEPEHAVHRALSELGDADKLGASYQRTFHRYEPKRIERRKRIMKASASIIATAAVVVIAVGLVPFMQPSAPAGSHASITSAVCPVATSSGMGQFSPAVGSILGGLPFTVQYSSTGVPQQVNHQGVVAVNGQRYSGTGYFRFALTDGTTVFWSNASMDSDTPPKPSAGVPLNVADGVYNVLLGNSLAHANMAALPVSVFTNENLSLRVWFDDGNPAHGVQLLTPDQPLAASPYAYLAATVADGSVTADKFAANLGAWAKSGAHINFNSGNVGIGVASPSQALEVNGMVKADGLINTALARVSLTGTSPSITTSAMTLPFSEISFDPGNDFNPTTYQYTVPIAGYYEIDACVLMVSGIVDQSRYAMVILKNGSTIMSECSLTPSGTQPVSLEIHDTLYLEAGSTIEIQARNLTGTGSSTQLHTISATSYMSIKMVAAD